MSHIVLRVAMGIPSRPDGEDLLLQVRLGLLRQGSSLNAWCAARKLPRSTAHRALTGERKGPASEAIRAQLIAAVEAA